MTRSLPPLLLFLSLLLLTGCELTVDVDVPRADPALVVDAQFEAGQRWNVALSQSASVQSADQPKGVLDAEIAIYRGDVLVEELLSCYQRPYDGRCQPPELSLPIRYTGQTAPQPGVTYTLRIRHPGFADVTATDAAPIAPGRGVFGGHATTRPQQATGSTHGVDAQLEQVDDSAQAYFYALELTRISPQPDSASWSPFVRSVLDLSFVSPSVALLRSPDSIFGTGGKHLFDIGYFSGAALERAGGGIQMRAFTSSPMMETHARLYALSPLYFDYVRSLLAYQSAGGGDNPLSESVRLVSNIDGGLGLFAGRSAPRLVRLDEP